MESPAILLKSAAYESNPTIRTDKVVKACRIITDILPYDKDSQSLIDEPELMKYLMVTLPLNPRAIDLIITTMIDKFKRVTVFLKETWQGFLQIASMEEDNNSPRKKDNDPWKVLQLGIRSLIKLKSTTTMKDLDDMTPSMRQQKYNDVITGKKAVLKETVLDYVDKFLMIYIKELKEVTSFKPNISELTKKFTTFSVSENVVKKTYALIDKVKALDPDLITETEPEAGPSSRKDTLSRLGTSLSNFDEPKDTKSKVGSLSKVGSEQTTTPMPSKPTISLKGKSLLQKIIEKKQKGSLEEVEEDDKSSDENKTEGEEDDDDDEDDSGLNGNENDIGSPELEQWMAEYKISDTPIIYRSEFAKDFIQEETNFDILFSYLFDPRRTSISECWKIKHPNMSSVVVEDKDKPVPPTPVHKEALGIFKLKDYKQLHPYVLRSYKVMQLFCDDRNYRDMIQAFPLVIGRFFQELHRNMTTKTDLMCNLNHIIAVIEYFVTKEPKLCVSYILHHNLIYKFFQNTELSSTQRLILLLFNCALNNQELEKDLQWKVLEYCRITSLFVDASSVILNGTNTFPLDKFKVEYKPPGITNVVDLANESLEPHDFKMSKSNSVEDKTNSRLVEETKGFIIDIDDIKGFLQQPKNINRKELISKNDSFVRTASKLNIKRYPSLMQKNYYENSVSGSESYRSALGVQTERTVLPPLENTALSKRNSQAKVDPSDFGLETLSNKNKVLAVDIPSSNIKKLAQTATPTKKPNALPLLPLKSIHSVSPATTKNQSTPGKPVAVRINVTQSAGKEPIFLGAKKADTERIREKVLEFGKVAQPKKEVVIPDTPEPIAKQKAAAAVSQTKLNSERNEYAPPERKNLLREFDLDVLGKAELEHLNELYPTSTRNMILTPLDKEAKKPEYKMKFIQANDQFALSLCELFNTLFQKMLMNAKTLLPLAIPACVHVDDELKQIYFKKRKLGYLPVDHGTFWKAVFVDQCTFVKNLLQNYLIKIKIHHFEEMNSGYVSGMIINSLLSNCSTNEFIKPYGKIIQNICRDNFLFLCKTLIQSYAWINRPELKVYLQDYEVNEPLGSGRIILAKTLDLIIQNDAENNFAIISQVNDTCWSTLITWFLNKKSNNLYHQIFYSIMQNTLLYTNEKTVLTILFKLNLLSSLYKIWNEIYQNGVLLKEKHVESMYYYLKRFTELIDQISKKHENYSVFISQLACSVSWSSLKAKFLTKPKVKKLTDKSKQKPRLPGVPSRVPSRAGSRVDIPGTASSMTRSRILADYSSQKAIDSPRGEKRIPTKERLF